MFPNLPKPTSDASKMVAPARWSVSDHFVFALSLCSSRTKRKLKGNKKASQLCFPQTLARAHDQYGSSFLSL